MHKLEAEILHVWCERVVEESERMTTTVPYFFAGALRDTHG